ncbi:MAG: hypothetical protein DMG82_24880 [Acidobacteria bacterium]|nr:MAG: hypothetical protein DMG82_24880 [Acidobacteriota bacterium]
MPGTTKKFTPEIDAELYEEFVAVAKQNRQSQRQVLEQALEFYGPPRSDGRVSAIGRSQS